MKYTNVQSYVIYNGIDEKVLPTKKLITKKIAELSKLIGKEKESFLKIVTVMSLNDRRKLNGLLHAKAPIKKILKKFNAVYIIVAYGKYLELAKKNYSQISNVYFIENQTRKEVMAVLKLSDIFYYPTLYDLHPNVILEAGISGMPVVTSSVGGIPEMIQNKKTGFLLNDIQFETFKYLSDFCISKKLRRTLGRKNKSHTKMHFKCSYILNSFVKVIIQYL
jgi:glycosyltransferase involved in cell wall biosynthesis